MKEGTVRFWSKPGLGSSFWSEPCLTGWESWLILLAPPQPSGPRCVLALPVARGHRLLWPLPWLLSCSCFTSVSCWNEHTHFPTVKNFLEDTLNTSGKKVWESTRILTMIYIWIVQSARKREGEGGGNEGERERENFIMWLARSLWMCILWEENQQMSLPSLGRAHFLLLHPTPVSLSVLKCAFLHFIEHREIFFPLLLVFYFWK